MICLHMMLSLKIKIKDIRHCKETDHVYAIVCQKRPRATHMAHTGNLPGSGGHHLGDPWFRLGTLGY